MKHIPSYLTYHSHQGSRVGTGEGGKESIATKGHLFGSNIPKSVSTLLKASGPADALEQGRGLIPPCSKVRGNSAKRERLIP